MADQKPMDTPITELGLAPEDVEKLTPAAKKLTKADLMKLGGWDNEDDAVQGYGSFGTLSAAPSLGLGVNDVQSINSTFSARMTSTGGIRGLGGTTGPVVSSGDYNCCCCPCCTGAAELESVPDID